MSGRLLLLIFALMLAACGSGPLRSPASGRDGPEAHPPPNLAAVPDATPRVEHIRQGGPNKPYEVAGESYKPITTDAPMVERGLASWYGKKFHGRPTASGEVYDMYAMTAAHATMPIPSYARVRNPANGREVIVRINDRGPFHAGRIIDLSYTAALKLGLLNGVAPVEVERITYEDIRSGAWMRGKTPADQPPLPGPPVYASAQAQDAPQQETTAVIAATETPEAAETSKATPSAPLHSSRGYWLQLGAFARLDGAENMRAKVAQDAVWLSPLLAIIKDRQLNRLQAGPYLTRADAQAAAEKLRSALSLASVIVQRK